MEGQHKYQIMNTGSIPVFCQDSDWLRWPTSEKNVSGVPGLQVDTWRNQLISNVVALTTNTYTFKQMLGILGSLY
jgi:hypothetical protein